MLSRLQASLSLDGIDDRVRVTHDASLNLVAQSAATLEAWVRLADSTGCHGIVTKDSYSFEICDGRLEFMGGEGSRQIPPNVWTHVAVVWREGETQSFYINGELDRTVPSGSTRIAANDRSSVYLGGSTGTLFRPIPNTLAGNLSEVRLWKAERTPNELRQTMHVAVEERLPNLVAVWHLSDDYRDAIGNREGTPLDGASRSSPRPPVSWNVAPIDSSFNSLAQPLHSAGMVYVPSANRAISIGGVSMGQSRDWVMSFDPGTGISEARTRLPIPLGLPAAVYVPATEARHSEKIFAFGGYDAGGDSSSNIIRLNSDGSEAAILANDLSVPVIGAQAVYHPGIDRILILGGSRALVPLDNDSAITIFDPNSQAVQARIVDPLMGRFGHTAVYSTLNGKIYVFGGRTDVGLSDDVLELTATTDLAGDLRIETRLIGRLPQAQADAAAVEDPHTKLIYLVGGNTPQGVTRVWAFDPRAPQVFVTPIEHPRLLESDEGSPPERISRSSVVYDPMHRHILVIGGVNKDREIWRIPLGDGPAIPLGRWDRPDLAIANPDPDSVFLPIAYPVSSIQGSQDRVLVGTSGGGAFAYNGDGSKTHYTAAMLGSGNVNGVFYEAARDRSWIATDAGVFLGVGESGLLLSDSRFGATSVLDVHGDSRGNIFLGTEGAGLAGLFFAPSGAGSLTSSDSTLADMDIAAIDDRGFGELWTLTRGGELFKVRYNESEFLSYVSYGFRCNTIAKDLAVTAGGERWLAANIEVGEFGEAGVCRDLADDSPQLFDRPLVTAGVSAREVSIDSDGRIWVAAEAQAGDSGGVLVYELVNPESAGLAGVRFDQFDWLSAPIGGRQLEASQTEWVSGFSSVGAVEERVWLGRTFGQLATFAPRWQQLDQHNDLDQKVVDHVWAAGGRIFAATASGLHVLLPDGRTWDNRPGVVAYSMLADSRGNLWVGTSSGPQIYLHSGWDTLADRMGPRPQGPVRAMVEDAAGRIWIGGDEGLTLFDRGRFVTTIDATTAALPAGPVTALLVDRYQNLWVGTATGLARLELTSDGIGSFQIFQQADGSPVVGLGSNAIHDLAETRDGTVAISTAEGLSLFTGLGFVPQTEIPIPARNLPLSVDDQGQLWAGAAVFSQGVWGGYYETNSGLRSGTISDNVSDGAGRVWFSHAPHTGLSVRGSYLPPLSEELMFATSFSPQVGQLGTQVRIEGSGFGNSPGEIRVTVGGTAIPMDRIVAVTDNRIDFRIAEDTLSGKVVVQRRGRRAELPGTFSARPVIERITPTGGNAGVVVDIFGTNLEPNALVSLGGGIFRPVTLSAEQQIHDPTHIRATILPGDGVGQVVVRNGSGFEDVLESTEFRKLDLRVAEVVLNQGILGNGLVDNKPTLFQHYLVHETSPRSSERIEVDHIETTFSAPDGSWTVGPYRRSLPAPTSRRLTHDSPLDPVLYETIDESLNLMLEPRFPDQYREGNVVVTTELLRNGQPVAPAFTQEQRFVNDTTLRVLLVPIMHEGYTSADLALMKSQADINFSQVRERLWPLGDVETVWAWDILTPDELIDDPFDTDGKISVGSRLNFYDASHELDAVRRSYNANSSIKFDSVYGVIENDSRIHVREGGAQGMAVTPDYNLLNELLLSHLDTVCDVAAVGLAIVSFGLAGDADGCSLEIPQRVAWGLHDADASTHAQEIGHNFGLVPLNSSNTDLFDSDNNPAHSIVDEVRNGDCSGGITEDERFDENLAIYANRPGVFGPIVNPLLNPQQVIPGVLLPQGQQFLNNFGTPSFSSDKEGKTRAKSVMSYACSTTSDNVFFEPVDMAYLRSTLLGDTNAVDEAVEFVARTGLRFLITGEIDEASAVGAISSVSALSNIAAPDLSYRSAYEIVQFDVHGIELGRTGIVPSFTVTHHLDGEGPGLGDEHGDASRGYFATTLAGLPGVARIELRHHERVLDVFDAGATPPVASVVVSSSNTPDGPAMMVEWNASDPDGDEVRTTLLVSVDDGETWRPFALRSASGFERIPLEIFPGTSAARVQVIASDGFQQASAVSDAFTISAKAPSPYIASLTNDSQLLEGQAIVLRGGAEDLQDGWLDDSRLIWHSDRDGLLGTGRLHVTSLSAGAHEITLRAVNSLGLAASTSLRVQVVGDYDADGIPDAAESALGLSPLRSALLAPDADGDGLSLIAELRHGTDPYGADTDGDGVNDGNELRQRSNPFAPDDQVESDSLAVFPTQIEMTVDLADGVRFPQAPFFVLSHLPAEFTVTSDAVWLQFSSSSGVTPATTIVLARATNLDDGVHRAVLTVSSPQYPLPVRVPVTVTVENVAAALDADGDGQWTWDDTNWIESGVGFVVGDDGYDFARDVDRDGDVDSDDVWLARTRFFNACLTVTNTMDDGPGSLRAVIECSNTLPEPGEIRFRIPAADPNFVDVDHHLEGGDFEPDVFMIRPLAPLPALIRGQIDINGQSQQSLTGDTNPLGPEIVLDGRWAGLAASGLELRSDANEVRGLNFQGFARHGVFIVGNSNQVSGSYVGTTPTGTAPFAGIEGLVGWWPAEGTAEDTAGEHEGALALGATYAAGLRGQAFQFDGSDDRVEIAEANPIPLESGLTLEAWIQTTSDDAVSTYEGNAALNMFGNSTNNVWVGFGVHGGKARYNFATGPSHWASLDGTSTVNDGAWHHLAVTHDEATGEARIYVDGKLEATTVLNYHTIDPYGVPVTIDRIGAGYSNRDSFAGLIDEPAVFGRPLSSAEVELIYRRGAAGKAPENPANGGSGVLIWHGDGNTIGGLAADDRNLISGNAEYGMLIVGNSGPAVPPDYAGPPILTDNPNDLGGRGNVVVNNYIGLGADGLTELGNRWSGVFIQDSANNRIGQGTPNGRNVISANAQTGMYLSGEGSFGNRLQANYIGTDALGESARGNRQIGVQLNYGARYNILGVDGDGINDSLEGNVISGHTHLPQDSGVWLGIGHHNVVAGNRIGTDWTGTRAIPNDTGIDVAGQSSLIGTNLDGVSDDLERNVISGNIVHGIILHSTTTDSRVHGNFIGVDRFGETALGNGYYGVWLSGADGNWIGGSVSTLPPPPPGEEVIRLPIPPTAGNVISGNGVDGIHLDSADRNVIQGNHIGVDYVGFAGLGNGRNGIWLVESSHNQIGGGEEGARNVIGDNLNGVALYYESTTHNKLQGNYIGVNSRGSAAIPNRGWGIDATYNVSFNTFGVDGDGQLDATEGNVISGHRGLVGSTAAIYLVGHDNSVAGNLLGLDATGRRALGNVYGVHLAGERNVVGTNGDGVSDALERNVIAANDAGIAVFAGADNVVAGNYVGTDATGRRALGNGVGIAIGESVLRTRVGTNGDGVGDEDERNVASGQGGIVGTTGIGIADGGIDTVVAGNYVGFGADGVMLLGNASHGIYLTSTALGSQIGGVAEAERNVIAGNGGHGVFIQGTAGAEAAQGRLSGSHDVLGNYIGTSVDGKSAAGNVGSGVYVEHSAQLRIGGAASGAGNVISGNHGFGIFATGLGTAELRVQGNTIGADAPGAGELPNSAGLRLENMHGALVGGSDEGAGNLISGNRGAAMELYGHDNVVAGNRVGTDRAGELAVGNGAGILVIGSRNRVGSDGDGVGDEFERNLISGNRGVGVGIYATPNGVYRGDANVVAGNDIGTNVDGTQMLGNDGDGVSVGFLWEAGGPNAFSPRGNVVGGDSASERNIIAGSGSYGVLLDDAVETRVLGNYIGTSGDGTAAFPNHRRAVAEMDGGRAGVMIVQGSRNQIGSGAPGEGNVISGNNGAGVILWYAGTEENRIQGNRIGTTALGDAALPNHGAGVLVWQGAGANVIGVDGDGRFDLQEGNLISGNTTSGVLISGSPGQTLRGNVIGLDATGAGVLGNQHDGVTIVESSDNRIAENVISGNLASGVSVVGHSSTENVVQSNRIGVAVDGSPRGNAGHGIRVWRGASQNLIGSRGTFAPGDTTGNVIAHNALDGVAVTDETSTGNQIRGNSIHSNGHLGIDLADDGPTANDKGNTTVAPIIAPDLDLGPNRLQNYPTISSARKTVNGANARVAVTGVLQSTPNREFLVDLYHNSTNGPHGRQWLATRQVTTSGAGTTNFNVSLPIGDANVGDYLTVTATDLTTGDTSEFSPAVEVRGNGGGNGRGLLAAAEPTRVTATMLTTGELQPLVRAAQARWLALGASRESLAQIQFGITNLPGNLLGLAEGNQVWIDANAAGWGWFVDRTPRSDSEFTRRGNQGERNRMDLLSVVLHEIGHALGHEHDETGVMAATLAAGQRPAEWSREQVHSVDRVFAETSDDENWDAWLRLQRRESNSRVSSARRRG